jgi:ABC-2 type transport system ATP-binding protein
MNVLTVQDLKKSFKRDVFAREVQVLKGVTFSLPPGTVTAFLGGNGAGKTTTIKSILGLLRKYSGSVRFFGDKELTKETLSRIGFLPERPYFYDYLTGNEFLEFYGQLSGKYTLKEIRSRAKKLIERVGLEAAADKRLRSYSKGMLQKIGIAQAIIHDPELVILDEPMSGLDPDGRLAVAEIIQDVRQKGASVFFSSHLINDAEKFCDRVVMLKDGKNVFEGDLDTLFQQTQKGFSLVTSKGEIIVHTDEQLQAAIADAIKLGEKIFEVRPVRMSLEEIFVTKVLRGTAT